MTLAGKYGIGVLSIGSMLEPRACRRCRRSGASPRRRPPSTAPTVDRKNWRVLLAGTSPRRASRRATRPATACMRWHNEYNVGTLQRPGDGPFTSPDEAVDKTAFERRRGRGHRHARRPRRRRSSDVYAKSGGFGTVLGFAHDWANPENTMRSWDMVARYVIPEINGYVAKLRESQKFLIENRAVFDRAGQAIMAKIMENKDAVEALKVTRIAALRRRQRRPAQAPQGEGGAGEEGQAAGG